MMYTIICFPHPRRVFIRVSFISNFFGNYVENCTTLIGEGYKQYSKCVGEDLVVSWVRNQVVGKTKLKVDVEAMMIY